jgi:imidazole glycerol-phosphate synthase subunit HisF
LIILGRAGKLKDTKESVDEFKIIGVTDGTIFVFKGKNKALLINYPSHNERFNEMQKKNG